MSNINAATKQKQILLFSLVAAAVIAAVGAGWYISTADQRSANDALPKEPVPDMTGVVNSQFDDKVQQSAITQFQVTNKEMKDEIAAVRREMSMLARERSADQQRLASLEAENKSLKDTLATGPSPDAPHGEPFPNVSSPVNSAATGDVPPPTTFYPGDASVTYDGMGTPLPGQTTMQPLMPMQPVDAIDSTTFKYGDDNNSHEPKYPYIPSGSFAKAIVIEGADTNAAVTGQQNTSPMQLRLIGHVQMPNDHEYDLTGCFVTLEAWGDVSSERAIVRSRGISCKKGKDVIDQKMAGHVSFMGKNGIKGEVIMRNGEILGWAWGAGFVDGIGAGIEKAATPQVGVGATATMGAGDVLKAGIGGGTGQAAKTLSDYYIKRAEQYHPIIPIGAGNEVTLVFQDGFQLETIEEERIRKANKPAQQQPVDQLGDPSITATLKDMKVGDLVHPTMQ
ncbi:F-type conjugal transfer pilus assembly protein TraB [Aeromonas salmonicida]|uniref:F-type conjugal transfer pilus assembly protein TraB n=1 Tax=Aeromonas salmonicida TaxID=645 RepID=UPI000B401C5B|nr:F-type conjugal transfer pilus assembly protein TraB [Aeromonas salmonicida]ARW85423.1 conjugal transfer protein TraB [Aeromonas salmonicida]